jgi:hypothetical protein
MALVAVDPGAVMAQLASRIAIQTLWLAAIEPFSTGWRVRLVGEGADIAA